MPRSLLAGFYVEPLAGFYLKGEENDNQPKRSTNRKPVSSGIIYSGMVIIMTCHWTDQLAPFVYFMLLYCLAALSTAALLIAVAYFIDKVKPRKTKKKYTHAEKRR